MSRSRRVPPFAVATAVAVVALVLGACGGDEADVADATTPVPVTTAPDPLDAVAEPAAGEGVAVLGDEELTFTVTACTQGPRPDDTPVASLDHSLEGEGSSDDGEFTVLVTRFLSDTGVGDPVVTETARIVFGSDGDERGVEAKRTTAGADGAWLDLADPTADGPLIDHTGDAYDVRGTFGPITATASEDGLSVGRLRAVCPA